MAGWTREVPMVEERPPEWQAARSSGLHDTRTDRVYPRRRRRESRGGGRMRRGVAVVLMGCTLLLTAGLARAVDKHDLSEDELQAEMAQNRALRAYVDRNGLPDVAETHFLADRPPWDEYEVRLYYLERRFEIAFARAFVLGRPEVQIEHYERPLTDQQVNALQSRVRMHSTPHAETTTTQDSRV